jgi:hypothetical protein
MNTRLVLAAALLLPGWIAPAASAFPSGAAPQPSFHLEAELGALWQSRNDVQIPNTGDGTRFSLRDPTGSGPWPSARLYLTWNIDSRHSLRALAAPLSFTETGELSSRTLFEGESFESNLPTEATYKFNSWRLTYRYRFYEGPRWDLWVGFTAKIRDAAIELRQGSRSSRKTDVGFVPLLHLEGRLRLGERWRIVLDADALAGGPGRAEDVSLKLEAALADRWSAAAGYRTVEGGADVEEVYNFAWLHVAVVSLTYGF